MMGLTMNVRVPENITGSIQLSCALKSYIYDDGETSSNVILLKDVRPNV